MSTFRLWQWLQGQQVQPDPKDVITTPRHPIGAAAPAKPMILTLAYYTKIYKVTGTTNTTYYKPGEWMSEDVAQKCCDTAGWTVITADNDIISALLSFGLAKVIP
jgi:hypothetical protein